MRRLERAAQMLGMMARHGMMVRRGMMARHKRGNFSATWTRGAKLTMNDAIINILGKKNHFECIINVVANFECILIPKGIYKVDSTI